MDIKDRSIYFWLLSGCILIAIMVFVGGITRLTQSGLSMVEWKPVMGAIPPLNESDWLKEFELYKRSPEYKYYNSSYTLCDFKSIFFWEYLHRLIGRILGLLFLVPCFFFWVKGKFSTKMKKKVILIFIGGICQGVLGWFMVKSGLVKNPHVSHYRLAAHLVAALVLIIYIYQTALWWLNGEKKRDVPLIQLNFLNGFISLLILQLIYGAFVAGLKAGKMYSTFPKMGDVWFPEEIKFGIKNQGGIALFESPAIVQLIHRILGISCFCVATYLLIKSKKYHFSIRTYLRTISILIWFQVILGVFTLVYAVPIGLGILHQGIAIIIILFAFHIRHIAKYEFDYK